MVSRDPPASPLDAIQAFLQPWHEAVADPVKAQEAVLHRLLTIYSQTEYGAQHGAAHIQTVNDYRRAFPIATYDDYKPLIQRVMAGEVRLLLNEEPVGWAITRGTTRGESKFIPMTPTDLRMRVSAGRAMMNYVATTGRLELFQGVNLNLNFPSVVGTVRVGDREVEYGYSSGIYTRFVSAQTPIRSVPSQDEIDALGGGKTQADWDARFELAYQKAKGENITLVGGVATTAVLFGRYLRRTHGLYPRELWKVQIATLGSVPGINTVYVPALHALYGPIAIREIYGATEGMFGQQRDERRAWVPNYDLFFFEVQSRSGLKMLHEMHPGEIGSLVVSTPILPRYRIGDQILAVRPPYYRCIGREKWWTPLRYFWDEFRAFNLGRL
ncbi:MAG: GH3 family domain-containing protein [Anaerolineae bacterium]